MKSRRLVDTSKERIFALVLESGEEAFAAVTAFAKAERLHGASLTAIGAFSSATVGWFDFENQRYKPIEVGEQCEVLSVIGDIALDDEQNASLHAHAVLGLSDGSTRGGHLLKGTVHPTLEVTLIETPAYLQRKKRPELGIALIDLG